MTYNQICVERFNAQQKLFHQVVTDCNWPKGPCSVIEIQSIMLYLSLADSNNFQVSGAGEREGRVFSQLVQYRSFGMAHGAGRSGNLTEEQPKAAGSNLLNRAARVLAKYALADSGFRAKDVLLLPFCTGMTINFIIQALRVKSVAWIRMDQKSVPKALELAGCTIIVVEGRYDGTYIVTDIAALASVIGSVDCVVSTTSCFAPRSPDAISEVARLCRRENKYHVVNNAYGIHSRQVMSELNGCSNVDYIVSSLDKNFMVPVGSCVVYSAKDNLGLLASKYAGRASAQGSIDVFLTLLEMGRDGWSRLQRERTEMYRYFVDELSKIPEITVVPVERNEISFYYYFNDDSIYSCGVIASRLFRAGVSGSKALRKGTVFRVADTQLLDFGRGCVHDGKDYITCAAAIGITKTDVENYVSRLKDAIASIKKAHVERVSRCLPPERGEL